MASIELTTPDGAQQIALHTDHITLGRLATNDIVLPYSHISRRHAELRLINGVWWVADQGSTNGLHINGQRVQEAPLQPGATIALSPHVALRLLLTSPNEPPPTAAPLLPESQPPPLSAYAPRSPYAEDEAPFYPHMRPAPPVHSEPRALSPSASSSDADHRAKPDRVAPSTPRKTAGETSERKSPSSDPQRRAQGIMERRRVATGAPSTTLYICQTCGQLTAPDAVYCQSCHHAIATECARCRLSLLPIQDLCPRCQTPNPVSVRRTRRATP
jgi:pSer/pThr/pTyr-binding forkhead associated (FHA) protein